jgi:rhomboid protease GluP
MIALHQRLTRLEAESYALVLSAAGIPHELSGAGDHWQLWVPDRWLSQAESQIEAYQSENPPVSDSTPAQVGKGHRNFSGILAALVLLAAHLAISGSADPEAYLKAFGASAVRIRGGEIYRCATALLLHGDWGHLVGNMAALGLFGSLVCIQTGSGLGWLLIMASGVGGNLVNALLRPVGFISIGASTAVFGAVGLLAAAAALAGHLRRPLGCRRYLAALGGGVALLAMLGASPKSDLGAHLFGFAIGILLGIPTALGVRQPPAGPWQALWGILTLLGITAAWMAGYWRAAPGVGSL